MNSLTELNAWGASVYEAADSRSSGVRLDKTPLNVILNITSTNLQVSAPAEIIEIINYSTAAVRFEVAIRRVSSPALPTSTISWTSLPAGVTLNTVGSTYTLSGINSISQWNAIKTFNWALPVDYANYTLWYLDVAILYFDSASGEQRRFSWSVFDPRFYYIAQLKSQFTATPVSGRVKFNGSTMSARFDLIEGIKVKLAEANLAVTSEVTALGELNLVNVNMTSQFTTTARIGKRVNINQTFNAVSTVSANLNPLVTGMINRLYNFNNSRLLFVASNNGKITQIGDPDPATNATFTIELTSTFTGIDAGLSDDAFVDYGDTISKNFTFSGTLTQVNQKLLEISIYPEYDRTTPVNVTYTQKKNGVTQYTKTITVTRDAAGTPVGRTITFNDSGIFYPTWAEYLYGQYDILLVGGGGGGQYGGGGGGEERTLLGIPSSRGLKNITIGRGGGGALWLNPTTIAINAQNGDATTVDNFTSFPFVQEARPGTGADSIGGGDSGNGNMGVNTLYGGGGGDGGAASGRNGGASSLSSITGLRYGGGGAGFQGISGGGVAGVGGNGITQNPPAGSQAGNGTKGIVVIKSRPV